MSTRERAPIYSVTLFLLNFIAFLSAGNALADGSGRAGYSGLTANKTCTSCHSGTATAPTVTITGPATVVAGSLNSYTVTIRGGPGVAGSLDIAATSGTLKATDSGTKLSRNEIVHSAPRAMVGGAASFTFSWQAPANAGPATLFVSGVSTNGNNSDVGDGTGKTSLVVTVGSSAGAGPTALIKGPAMGVAGVSLAFDGSGSISPAGSTSLYDWNFGDNTAGAGAVVNHTFVAGNFTVRLTVTDSTGATNSTTIGVMIAAASAAPGPVANAGGPYTGTAGSAVAFDASRSTGSAGALATYKWNFGDSQIGQGKTVLHTYSTAGVFNVTLEVIDASGISAFTQTRADIAAPSVMVSPSTGETVYDTHCASCHGAGGAGGSASNVVGASVTDIKEAVREVRTMRSLRNVLSSSEIADMATYLTAAGSDSRSNDESDDDSDEATNEDSDQNSTGRDSSRSRDNAVISTQSEKPGDQANPFNTKAVRAGGLDGTFLLYVAAGGLLARSRRIKARAR